MPFFSIEATDIKVIGIEGKEKKPTKPRAYMCYLLLIM